MNKLNSPNLCCLQEPKGGNNSDLSSEVLDLTLSLGQSEHKVYIIGLELTDGTYLCVCRPITTPNSQHALLLTLARQIWASRGYACSREASGCWGLH